MSIRFYFFKEKLYIDWDTENLNILQNFMKISLKALKNGFNSRKSEKKTKKS